jgi:nucleoside-diphosphate-sugar epimerase
MEGKNVAILGATGFLGKQILLGLVNNGYIVTVILRNDNNDSVNFSVRTVSLDKFLSCQEEFDFIINCAGYYSRSTQFLDIYKIRKSNYILVKKLIKFRKKNGGVLIVFGSYFEERPSWKKMPASYYTKYKLEAKKKLKISAKNISSPTFYIYLFDTYGEDDNRNKVLTYIIREFKAGNIPILTNSSEFINWSHNADIAASIIRLLDNSNKYSSYRLHEFQIRSLDEFRLADFINTISSKINLNKSSYKKNFNSNNLLDCAPNLNYFEAKNNVIDFTLNSIQRNDPIE